MTAATTYTADGKTASRRAGQRWTERAACRRPGIDPELFFPVGGSGPALAQAADAKEICAGCLVRHSCLASALRSGEPDGIWGGTTPEERRSLRARLRRSAPGRRWEDNWRPPRPGSG